MSTEFRTEEPLLDEKKRKMNLYLIGSISGGITLEGFQGGFPRYDELDYDLQKALNLAYERGYDAGESEQLGRVIYQFSRVSGDKNEKGELTQVGLAKCLDAAIRALDDVDGKKLFKRTKSTGSSLEEVDRKDPNQERHEESVGVVARLRKLFGRG